MMKNMVLGILAIGGGSLIASGPHEGSALLGASDKGQALIRIQIEHNSIPATRESHNSLTPLTVDIAGRTSSPRTSVSSSPSDDARELGREERKDKAIENLINGSGLALVMGTCSVANFLAASVWLSLCIKHPGQPSARWYPVLTSFLYAWSLFFAIVTVRHVVRACRGGWQLHSLRR